MIVHRILKYVRAHQNFQFRRGLFLVGRFFRLVAMLMLDLAVLYIVLRGIGIGAPAPFSLLVGAGWSYLVARMILRYTDPVQIAARKSAKA